MIRHGTTFEYRDLAQQLLAHEASLRSPSGAAHAGRPAVIERLLPTLVPLVGKTGCSSLLARALTVARREAKELREVRVTDDCTVEGLFDSADSATGILLTHLIGLLTTLLGETLTLRLLQNAWPELPLFQQASVEPSDHE